MTLTKAEKLAHYNESKSNPEYFWKWTLGSETIYDKQIQMVEAVRDHNRVAVVGANGTGKDWQAARIMLWWQSVYNPAEVSFVAIAVSRSRDKESACVATLSPYSATYP